MDTPETTPQEQLEIEAVRNKHERVRKLAEVPQPKRRTAEFKNLTKLAAASHELLNAYDLEEEPGDYAEVAMEIFQSAVARMHLLMAPPGTPEA